VLILYCEEGDGHRSAAETMVAQLARTGVRAVAYDAFAGGLGRVIPMFSRDAYRLQIRWLRWTYGLEYLLFAKFAPTRAIARRGLAFFGRRPLARLIASVGADVIVSTHPAVSNVLGWMRLRGQLSTPTVATITDFGVHALWAHPGIDLHLVMHADSLAVIERIAGSGSARVTEPIVAPEFVSPPDKLAAREALDLPLEGPIAVISGGGWGVGDVASTAEAALAVPGLHVVCLSGRNTVLHRRLERRLGDQPRVQILPFTERMPELLAAADVLIDSTLGVTALEALTAGCRVIAFGAPPGHSRDNARALAALGLAEAPSSRRQLISTLLGATTAGAVLQRQTLPPADPLAAAILGIRPRVSAVRSPRTSLIVTFGLAAAVGLAMLTFASPIPYPVVAGALGLGSLTHVRTHAREVGLIVETSQADIPELEAVLAREQLRASFAVAQPPAAATTVSVAEHHDALVPELPDNTSVPQMFTIGRELRHLASALGLVHRFYYYVRGSALTLGEYLLARTDGGLPVTESVVVNATGDGGSWRVSSPVEPGSILVIDASRVRAPRRALAALRSLLDRRHLRGVSLEALLASAASDRTRPRAGEADRSTIGLAPTSSNETTRPRALRGEVGHHSWASTGASATGTNVVSAKMIGATCFTERLCSADISPNVPRPELSPMSTNQTAHTSHA
jgi:UDP-N-acetylglucosamine:LPS N-acetylglucosamine transferase